VASPRISVVVPFYNVAGLLGECLQSIAAQTFRDLEVIMVDDGSTDASTEIARAQAARDPRFALIQAPSLGAGRGPGFARAPGHARNLGIALATGDFLAFVDADDMLPPDAYEVLLGALERSDSDFACGNVNRIGPYGVRQSALHSHAIKGSRRSTHITKAPHLLYDISVFNKLFLRSFWDAHQLSFPEGKAWEDIELMTQAHVLARAVDVIGAHVYYWRERGLGELSITQSRTDIRNLRDRIEALLAIDGFLASHAPASLLLRHQRKALTNDLWLYVLDLYKVGDDYRREFVDLAGSYLDQVSRRVLRTLPAAQKLGYHLIKQGAIRELVGLVAWQLRQPVRAVPLVRRRGRLVADLPFRDDPRLRIPAWVLRPSWRELDPFVRVEEVGWRRGKMVIAGRAYIPSIDIVKRRHSSKIVVFRPRQRWRPPIVLRARSFEHQEATERSRQDRYSYEWAGFRCQLSPRWFRLLGRWMTGEWDGYVLVRSRGVWRPARIHTPQLGQAERPGFRDLAPDIRLRARWEGRNLVVGVVRIPAVLAGHAAVPGPGGRVGRIDLEVDLAGITPAAAQRAELLLIRQGGGTALTFPARVTAPSGADPRRRGDRRHVSAGRGAGAGRRSTAAAKRVAAVRLSAGVALDALIAGTGTGTGAGASARSGAGAAESAGPGAGGSATESAGGGGRGDAGGQAEGAAWDVYVSLGRRGRLRVALPADAGTAAGRYLSGLREVALTGNRDGDLVISQRPPHAVIAAHTWSADNRLQLRGSYAGAEGALGGLVLRRHGSGEQHLLPCHHDGEHFTAEIDVSHLSSFGEDLPLRDGRWDILFQPAVGGPGEDLVQASYDQAQLARISEEPAEVGAKQYRLIVVGDDRPVITTTARRRLTERGMFRQRILRNAYYPLKLRAPLRDAVVFVSWKGKQCTDNPAGIAAELRSRGDDREHIWVVTDPAVHVPDGATRVLAGTQEYYEALARSRYLIANDDMPAHYRKRDGQIYLQTWHGTPLKRIGFDIERPQFVSGASYLDHLAEDVANWDLLLSQNPFSTPILRRAFRFDGEVCEYGYPRNDVLRRPDARELAAAVRRRIGLAGGKRVVLYAPTWRDNQFYAAGRYRFDLRLDLEHAHKALGDEYVILIRGHHHMADDVPDASLPGFAINVTRYPDISELFLVSDVLVTDYSSVMFDYASTGRPMLFFTYDLGDYRDNLRGFYFDFQAEAPGPLLATSADVIAAIGDIDALAVRYAAEYDAFAAKFCPFDDGKVAGRVCDRLFGQ
jgi:CDP-glycerol glycerophosphotransferase